MSWTGMAVEKRKFSKIPNWRHYLLQRQNRKGFLNRIVTGDEKWLHCGNSKLRKSLGMLENASTLTARPNIHDAKVMLCIWWDQLDVVYYELLKWSETITEDRYQTKLMRLRQALKEKRPQYQEGHGNVILQHDNARPHVARPVKSYLTTLKWEVLPHPSYSPDIDQKAYRCCEMVSGNCHKDGKK